MVLSDSAAQDVQAVYPDAVIEDANGYLTIDLPVLADQDELIAKIVMEGGASTVGGACWWCVWNSDKRLKTNIQLLSMLDIGVGLYSWEWNKVAKEKNLHFAPKIGVIAQELQTLHPEFVVKRDGYLMVNYYELIKQNPALIRALGLWKNKKSI